MFVISKITDLKKYNGVQNSQKVDKSLFKEKRKEKDGINIQNLQIIKLQVHKITHLTFYDNNNLI